MSKQECYHYQLYHQEHDDEQMSINELFYDDFKEDKEFWEIAAMQLSHQEDNEQTKTCDDDSCKEISTFDKEDEEFWKTVAKQLSHEEQPDTCDDEEKISTFDKEDEEFWKTVAKQLSHEEEQPDTCDDEKITFDNEKDEEFWKRVAKQLSHEEEQPDTVDIQNLPSVFHDAPGEEDFYGFT